LWSRYSLLTWPLLGAAYLVWVKAGQRWVPIALCLAATLAFPGNMGTGMLIGNGIREHYTKLESDVRAGLSAEEIVRKDVAEGPNAGQKERAIRGIPMLREAGIGIFAPGEPRGISPLAWLLAGFVALAFGVRWVWHLGKAVQAERARELFRLQHERFEEQLLK